MTDSIRDKMDRCALQQAQEYELNKKKYQEQSLKRLLKIIERKLQTSFIGALSQFETTFGNLWGHGKNEEDLNKQERMMRELWNMARTIILNNGNNQIRAVQNELHQYTIEWNGYQMVFKPSEPKKEE